MTPSRTEDPTPQSRCRFALAWCDITPPANIYHRMWGAAKHERAAGIHRPLRATVTVFAPLEGNERQILLACNYTFIPQLVATFKELDFLHMLLELVQARNRCVTAA